MINLKSAISRSILCLTILTIVTEVSNQNTSDNITKWCHHRREKRFLIFQNAGICKLVCGVTLPVDLYDKKPWRQLVMLYNVQFQFPQPTTPIYWWNKWDKRFIKDQLSYFTLQKSPVFKTNADSKDNVQILLYELVVEYLNQHGTNGHECLQLAICENSQIHQNSGLFSEILDRILIPHPSTGKLYLDAYNAGKYGMDCKIHYPNAKKCIIDKFLHNRHVLPEQTFLKNNV